MGYDDVDSLVVKVSDCRGNIIRNYKSSSRCLMNVVYCCVNFVIYKSFKFIEFINK